MKNRFKVKINYTKIHDNKEERKKEETKSG